MATETTADPLWVRETLCEDLASVDRQSGRLPDTRAIEHVVSGDIHAFQAQQREAKPARAREPQKPKQNAKQVAKELGYELYKKPIPKKEQKTPRCVCLGGRCKRCKLFIRIDQLMKLEPGLSGAALRVMPFKYKDSKGLEFGRELVEITYRCNQKRGEFKGLNAVDANRLLLRRLEDVADKSNGVPGLGAWWTK